jgi:hypothetical protein
MSAMRQEGAAKAMAAASRNLGIADFDTFRHTKGISTRMPRRLRFVCHKLGTDYLPCPYSYRQSSKSRDLVMLLTLAAIHRGHSKRPNRSNERSCSAVGSTGYSGSTSRERRLVWVNSDCQEAERIRILSHELAHIRCDHFGRDVSRAQGECEADSVAFVVCQALGFDISSSAVDYVATWASRDNPEVLEEALAAIHTAAASILGDLDQNGDES